jgi:uncharacterized membrane protein YkvA (DUF1232 family)
MNHWFSRMKSWARSIKQDAVMLWFARAHPKTPLIAQLLVILTVAYALSPIDLIPDFIPVLGYLDDLVIVPILIWLTVKLLPEEVIQESREKARQWMEVRQKKPISKLGAVLMVLLWAGALYLIWRWWSQH